MTDIQPKYFTPQEILEKYPALKNRMNWTTNDLGNFLKCKLLVGYYDRGKRIAMIEETSVIELIRHTNKIIESQLLTI